MTCTWSLTLLAFLLLPASPTQAADFDGSAVLVQARDVSLLVDFESGTTELSSEARRSLRVFSRAMLAESDRSQRVELVGHADEADGARVGYRLAWHRAETVKDFLVTRGLSPSRMETSSAPVFEPPRARLSFPRERAPAPQVRLGDEREE